MMPSTPGESAVDDFSVASFCLLSYGRHLRAIRTRKELWFLVHGEYKYTKPDVWITDRDVNNVILLVQEDKQFGESHAQLIAEAIAVFQDNNAHRSLRSRLPGN